MSEAGSMIASPAHLTGEMAEKEYQKNDVSLAGQLAAAIKKRKTKKTKEEDAEDKDTRGSFRKRWSLRRRSRDKNKSSPSATRAQEQETPPQATKPVEPAGLAEPTIEEHAGEERGDDVEVKPTDKERLPPNSNEGGIQGEMKESQGFPYRVVEWCRKTLSCG